MVSDHSVLKNRARLARFDRVTIGVHWVSAGLVLAMFASAWLRWQSHDEAYRSALLQFHRSTGLTIWVATTFRLCWRLTNMKFPPFPANITNARRFFVQTSEFCLYTLLLAQPATGLAVTLLNARPFALFGAQLPAFPLADKPIWDSAREAHYWGAWAFAAIVLIHSAAGLFHHLVLHDDVLENMAPVFARKPLPGITPVRP